MKTNDRPSSSKSENPLGYDFTPPQINMSPSHGTDKKYAHIIPLSIHLEEGKKQNQDIEKIASSFEKKKKKFFPLKNILKNNDY